MAITFPYAGGWNEVFAAVSTTATRDVGTGSNRRAVAILAYIGGSPTFPVPTTLTLGSDSIAASGSTFTDATGNKYQLYVSSTDLTVSGLVTCTGSFSGGGGGPGGGAQCALLVIQGGGALTISNVLSLLEQGTGGAGGSNSRTVTSSIGNTVVRLMLEFNGATGTADTPATLITSSQSGKFFEKDTASGASTVMSMTWGAFGAIVNTGFTVSEPGAAPVITGPTGAATGPTQATIGVTSDTTGSISSLILPAATAAPADAATLIADGAAVVRTIATAGTPQTFAVTGLTTNTAARVHWAMAGSNVQSSSAFTPNTLAISGTALSAQTGAAGAAFAWTGATPESLITNTGNGSGAWTATAGVGASGVTVNSSTGILVAGSLGTAGSYTITLRRADGSTVPGAQTVTKTVGLTIGAGGAATAVTNAGPSSGTSGSASTNFTAGANGTITGTVIVTPSDSGGGGTFTPSTVSISSGTPTATYTYTAGSAGVKSITVTNNGGLTNPSAISYTASAASGSFNLNNAIYAFKDNNGDLLASLGVTFWASNPTTGALVGAAVTGLSTNASGIVTTAVAPSGAVAGTTYRLNYKFASGEYGVVEMAAV